jgi:pyruvate/2-oxoglutarate dehydrogenase complex dihydrolipoamide dehydrogenase (E3) component
VTQTIETDLCVIGAGSAGLTLAAGASQMGARVVLVERARMGGDCLNTGCVPSKALLAAGKAARAGRDAARFGIGYGAPEVDWQAVSRHVHGVIAAIEPMDSVERFEGLGVTVLQAEARFLDRRSVQAGDRVVKAKWFAVATGSRAMVPPVPGLDRVPYWTNETVFDNDRPVDHLLVLGGGPIGLEMADAHRRLGAQVTVVEMAKALPRDEPELADVVLRRLRASGIVILEGAKATTVEQQGATVRLWVETADGARVLEGSHLLVAAGRQPNLEGLDLDKAGVAYGRRGITVDARLRSSNPRVFAIGDIAGGAQFTHVAGHHGGVALQNMLFRLPVKAATRTIPWVTYTDPELAQVGLTEQAAREAGHRVQVLRWPFAENDRAQTERDIEGLVKVVLDRRGRVLGAGIAGPHAGEQIALWCLAVSQRLPIRKLASVMLPYPTLSEASKRAAGSFFTPSLFSERTRRIVRFLLRFA